MVGNERLGMRIQLRGQSGPRGLRTFIHPIAPIYLAPTWFVG